MEDKKLWDLESKSCNIACLTGANLGQVDGVHLTKIRLIMEDQKLWDPKFDCYNTACLIGDELLTLKHEQGYVRSRCFVDLLFFGYNPSTCTFKKI